MEAATFTAWQILVSKGLKKSWREYRKNMVPDPTKSKKVTKSEREEAIAAALKINELYANGATGGRS